MYGNVTSVCICLSSVPEVFRIYELTFVQNPTANSPPRGPAARPSTRPWRWHGQGLQSQCKLRREDSWMFSRPDSPTESKSGGVWLGFRAKLTQRPKNIGKKYATDGAWRALRERYRPVGRSQNSNIKQWIEAFCSPACRHGGWVSRSIRQTQCQDDPP